MLILLGCVILGCVGVGVMMSCYLEQGRVVVLAGSLGVATSCLIGVV